MTELAMLSRSFGGVEVKTTLLRVEGLEGQCLDHDVPSMPSHSKVWTTRSGGVTSRERLSKT
jgi:hypothetical protein